MIVILLITHQITWSKITSGNLGALRQCWWLLFYSIVNSKLWYPFFRDLDISFRELYYLFYNLHIYHSNWCCLNHQLIHVYPCFPLLTLYFSKDCEQKCSLFFLTGATLHKGARLLKKTTICCAVPLHFWML